MSAPYPWQQGLWSSLLRLHAAGRLPHALLLAAAEGSGRHDLALALAARLLCQSPAGELACGRCRSCQWLAAGSHPDFLRVSPEVDGDKVSKVIKVDQAREVVQFASQSAQMQGWRVVVLSPAHALNTASANALLKTLEEPGRDTLFLLLTDQPMSLLPTIRSRCQLLPLGVPDTQLARQWLRSQPGLPETADDAVADTLLALTRGAPLAARDLLQAEWYQQRGALIADLLAVADDRAAPLTLSTQWGKRDAMAQITIWQSLLDDAVQLALVPDADCRHRDLAAELKQLAAAVSAEVLLYTLAQAVEARRLLDTTVQPHAILDALWLHWGRKTRTRGSHAG